MDRRQGYRMIERDDEILGGGYEISEMLIRVAHS